MIANKIARFPGAVKIMTSCKDFVDISRLGVQDFQTVGYEISRKGSYDPLTNSMQVN